MESRDTDGGPADRRSAQRAGIVVPLAVGVLTLIAVIGAAAHSGVRLSDRGPLAEERGPLLVIGGLLLLVDILVIAMIRRVLRGRRRLQIEAPRFGDEEAIREPWWVRLLTYLIMVVLVALPLLLIYFGLRRHDALLTEREQGPPAEVPNIKPPEAVISEGTLTAMVFIALAAIVVGAYISYRQLHQRHPTRTIFDADMGGDEEAESPVDQHALASAVDAGAAAIKTARTPREAIIACYAAMELTLAEHGTPRLRSDTPAELLVRAGAAGLVRSEASQTLTDIFRRARFSLHPVGERDVEAAEAALARLRADLGVRT